MASHEHTVVVERPLRVVYDQWTQFESYPRFMDDVEEVRQLDDTHLHWRVSIGGVEREYDASIVEQRPDEVISWSTEQGPRQAGVVTFAPIDPEHTKVTLQLDFEPQGVTENVGDKLGFVERSVESSLERFKDFIEQRGVPEGSWRGSVQQPDAGRMSPPSSTEATSGGMPSTGGMSGSGGMSGTSSPLE